MTKTCVVCSSRLGDKNTSGYCARHHNQNPAKRAKLAAAAKRAYQTDPTLRERKREIAREIASRPGERERRAEQTRKIRMWEKSVVTPEARAIQAARCSATKMAWCPSHLRGLARELNQKKKIPIAEVKVMIAEMHEKELAEARAKIQAQVDEADRRRKDKWLARVEFENALTRSG